MNSRQMIPGGSPLGKGSVYLEARFIILTSFLVTSNLLEIPETFINSAFFLFNQCQVYSSFLSQLLEVTQQNCKIQNFPSLKEKTEIQAKRKEPRMQPCGGFVNRSTDIFPETDGRHYRQKAFLLTRNCQYSLNPK